MKHYLLIIYIFIFCSCFTPEKLAHNGICAHRGANSTHPENTIPAFIKAVRLGVQQIELDVQRTKDNYLILMHDSKVDRTTDGKGMVGDLTFAAIRMLDAGLKKDEKFKGTKVPTLEEALDVIPKNIWINVHLKGDEQTALMVAKVIVEKNMVEQAFLACSRSCAMAVRNVYPEIMICNMERHVNNISRYVDETIDWECQFIQLRQLCTTEEMFQLKQAGVRVNYFGVESPEHFKALIEAGVDFLLIDDIEQYRDVAAKVKIFLK